MPLGMEVGPGPGHIVLDGDPPCKGAEPRPQFSVHACCGQMAGWIKMPVGREVDVGPGDIVLDGDPAPLNKGHSTPSYRPMSVVAKRSPISATAELLFCVHLWFCSPAMRLSSCFIGGEWAPSPCWSLVSKMT